VPESLAQSEWVPVRKSGQESEMTWSS
jgi:hypothetical protein